MLDARLSTLTFATKKTCFKRTGRDFSTCWPSRSNGTRRATVHLSRLPFCLDICVKIEGALTARLRGKPATAVPIPILANYLAGELFTLLQWWLDQKMPYPPERMDEIFHALVNPTLRAIVD